MELETPRGKLLLCHGLGEDSMWFLGSEEDDVSGIDTESALHAVRRWQHRFMVGGHTHRRMVRRLGKLVVINPGTLLRYQDPCVAIADFDAETTTWLDLEPDLSFTPKPAVAWPK